MVLVLNNLSLLFLSKLIIFCLFSIRKLYVVVYSVLWITLFVSILFSVYMFWFLLMQWSDSVFATFLSFRITLKFCFPAILLVNDRVLPRNCALVLCFDATEFEKKKNTEGLHCLGFLKVFWRSRPTVLVLLLYSDILSMEYQRFNKVTKK